MAADKGHNDSINTYGNILLNGEGVTIDKTEAAKYFKLGADNNHLDSITNYVYMLWYEDDK